MIQFRCWYCGRRFLKSDEQVGSYLTCSCQHLLRVPRRSGGRSQVKTLLDRLVEGIVYGGGGALLGLGLSLLILSQGRGLLPTRRTGALLAALTLFGFLAGLLGGERGVNYVGRLIREREQR